METHNVPTFFCWAALRPMIEISPVLEPLRYAHVGVTIMVTVFLPEVIFSVPYPLPMSTLTVLLVPLDVELTATWTPACLRSALFVALMTDAADGFFTEAWAATGNAVTRTVDPRAKERRGTRERREICMP
jgi:hypothetical protein